MAAKKTPAGEMSQRAVDALYDAQLVGGMFGSDLTPRLSLTGNEARAWNILHDLVEAGRVERSGVGEDARYQLSAAERDAEFFRRFALYRPDPSKERSTNGR
jgi:hypothetical protein